jgi:hypothetical protein
MYLYQDERALPGKLEKLKEKKGFLAPLPLIHSIAHTFSHFLLSLSLSSSL